MCRRRHAIDLSNLGAHSTSLQQAKVLERSNSLRRKIDAWIEIQHLYVPAIASLRARADAQGGGTPSAVQDIPLFLPSQIIDIITDRNLLNYEWEFRYAQADETLGDLRGLILLRSHMYKSKGKHSRGQKQQTRSMNLLSRVEERIKATAGKYRKIRSALVALSVPLLQFAWKDTFRTLEDSDLIGLTSMDDSSSEGWKRLTWIWSVQGTGADVDTLTQAGKPPFFFFPCGCDAK